MSELGLCTVEGCANGAGARGWCQGHYLRWYRLGDVRADIPLFQSRRLELPEGGAWESVKNLRGLTYRKFDHWVTTGLIHCEIEKSKGSGSGNWRTITPAEVEIVRMMAELTEAGMLPAGAARIARIVQSAGSVAIGSLRIGRAE